MIDTNNIEELRFHTETQLFDRKSARIDPKALSNLIIAFANAETVVLQPLASKMTAP